MAPVTNAMMNRMDDISTSAKTIICEAFSCLRLRGI
jgi:hypothetical protein